MPWRPARAGQIIIVKTGHGTCITLPRDHVVLGSADRGSRIEGDNGLDSRLRVDSRQPRQSRCRSQSRDPGDFASRRTSHQPLWPAVNVGRDLFLAIIQTGRYAPKVFVASRLGASPCRHAWRHQLSVSHRGHSWRGRRRREGWDCETYGRRPGARRVVVAAMERCVED
jgi:hypothetical protein